MHDLVKASLGSRECELGLSLRGPKRILTDSGAQSGSRARGDEVKHTRRWASEAEASRGERKASLWSGRRHCGSRGLTGRARAGRRSEGPWPLANHEVTWSPAPHPAGTTSSGRPPNKQPVYLPPCCPEEHPVLMKKKPLHEKLWVRAKVRLFYFGSLGDSNE